MYKYFSISNLYHLINYFSGHFLFKTVTGHFLFSLLASLTEFQTRVAQRKSQRRNADGASRQRYCAKISIFFPVRRLRTCIFKKIFLKAHFNFFTSRTSHTRPSGRASSPSG